MRRASKPPEAHRFDIFINSNKYSVTAEYDERFWAWRALITPSLRSNNPDPMIPLILAPDPYRCLGLAAAWCYSFADGRQLPELKPSRETSDRDDFFSGCTLTYSDPDE